MPTTTLGAPPRIFRPCNGPASSNFWLKTCPKQQDPTLDRTRSNEWWIEIKPRVPLHGFISFDTRDI